MQMAQKQVLAPRMIQSMEILQLPIIALQERIEQEMEDNPVLDQIEPTGEEDEGQGSLDEAVNADAEKPDALEETERELVVKEDANNEDDFERLLNMSENLPDEYDEQSRPSRGQIEAEGDRRHDQMANMVARPQSLHDYLHDQLGWFEISAELRAMCDRIIYNLDPNGYLQGRLEDLIEPDAPPAQLVLAQKALAMVA